MNGRNTRNVIDPVMELGWANPSGSSSSMSMNRSGPIGGSSSTMFGGSGGYSDAIPSMGMMNMQSSASYNDRFDAYKTGIRKY